MQPAWEEPLTSMLLTHWDIWDPRTSQYPYDTPTPLYNKTIGTVGRTSPPPAAPDLPTSPPDMARPRWPTWGAGDPYCPPLPTTLPFCPCLEVARASLPISGTGMPDRTYSTCLTTPHSLPHIWLTSHSPVLGLYGPMDSGRTLT